MTVLEKRQPDLTIMAESVYKPHNLSAMLRSCDAVGIGRILAVNPTGGVETFTTTSASAEKWVEVETYSATDKALTHVEDQGMQILAAHFSERAVDYRSVDYCRPTCIVFGNEKDGVSTIAARRADAHIIIPMIGMVRSLNVSVATAVILFEAQRQRSISGHYASPKLDAVQRHEMAFEWLYPREALLCRESGRAYPPLDEEGSIIRSE
ncbi:MAG: tRNA (guanosine(18)-2'-O)-methyltransferase TrmH [Trueperaceae bacterium]|nr:MAG: tRNA (guanosine(18)-2'-O)-methyltransferase TrmH [Trueperaceae bacterium]